MWQCSIGKILLFLSIANFLVAQENGFQKINFEGTKRTKDSHLLSIIDQRPTYTQDQLEKNLQLIKNQPGISSASFVVDSASLDYPISYIIEERRTALPILSFGGVEDNLWYSIGWKDNNFRGKGEDILVHYINTDNRHGGQIFYRNPMVRKSKWGYSINAYRLSSIEPIFFDAGTVKYLFDNNGIGLSLIRNLSTRNQVEFGGIFFNEVYKKQAGQSLPSDLGPDELSLYKYLNKLQFQHNALDYDFFYLEGIQIKTTFQNVVNFLDNSWFYSIQFQLIYFSRPTEWINFASRLKLALSTNENSPFAPFVADSRVNIRGIGNRIDRGTAQAVLNLEVRQTILHLNHWAAQFVVFSDLGSWRNPGGELKDIFNQDQFRHFVGGGFRLVYQKIFGATIRIDYGIDIYNTRQRGFVLGLGQYF